MCCQAKYRIAVVNPFYTTGVKNQRKNFIPLCFVSDNGYLFAVSQIDASLYTEFCKQYSNFSFIDSLILRGTKGSTADFTPFVAETQTYDLPEGEEVLVTDFFVPTEHPVIHYRVYVNGMTEEGGSVLYRFTPDGFASEFLLGQELELETLSGLRFAADSPGLTFSVEVIVQGNTISPAEHDSTLVLNQIKQLVESIDDGYCNAQAISILHPFGLVVLEEY